jgi:hypothetical protein
MDELKSNKNLNIILVTQFLEEMVEELSWAF